jgi:hypothetical protein
MHARRIWIDAPYVFPKAMLVDAVAGANRCRSVVSEAIGFATVIGTSRDLEAVELLATSLLVQASRAMLASGHGGSSGARTSAFRRAFLVAYAIRIGERLAAVTEQAMEATGRSQALVPVLRDHAERVEAARQEMFPRTTARVAQVRDERGWVLGRAAADQARLDLREAVAG